MQIPTTQLILALITVASVASLIYCILYFFFCALERVSYHLAAIVGLIVPAIFIYSYKFLGFIPAAAEFLEYVPYMVAASLVGSVVHRKLHGTRNSFFQCFLLMLLISFSGLTIFVAVIRWTNLIISMSLILLNSYPFLTATLITIQFLATPILLLILKNSRLRPGVDKHLGS